MLAKEKPESCCVTDSLCAAGPSAAPPAAEMCVCFSELKLCTGMGGCSALNSYCEMCWNVQEIP